jgi:uncharacterized protein
MKKLILALMSLVLTGCLADGFARASLYPWKMANKNFPSTVGRLESPHPTGPIIFYLHGNGETIEAVVKSGLVTRLNQIGHVIIPEYPGLGPVPGEPSQATIVAHVKSEYRKVKAQWVGSGRRIYIVGWSLGAAVASQLSSEGADGVLLISPWKTFKEVAKAQSKIAGLVSDKFYRENEWNSLGAVKEYRGKVAVIHGKFDSLIPYSHGDAIAKALAAPIFSIEANHNDVFTKQEARKAMEGFLK